MTATAGFFGKIPTRGDFVRQNLPPDFTQSLDAWWQRVLSHSRGMLGERWDAIWMEAPVWRFAFAPGVCGSGAAIGLWLPSTDRAGRLFPLTIAAVAPHWRDVARGVGFLAEAAEIGIGAIEQDIEPDAIGRAVAAALRPEGDRLEEPAPGSGLWWTDGSPLVAPATYRLRGMPDGARFTAMLTDQPGGWEAHEIMA